MEGGGGGWVGVWVSRWVVGGQGAGAGLGAALSLACSSLSAIMIYFLITSLASDISNIFFPVCDFFISSFSGYLFIFHHAICISI